MVLVFRLRRGVLDPYARRTGTPASSLTARAGNRRGPNSCSRNLERVFWLQRAREAERAAPSLLSTYARNSADAQIVMFPDLGRLRLADTVYLLEEGTKTVGLVFARDVSARTCLLTLDLRPTDGAVAWHATVERVTREGAHSSDGVGASFLFYPRLQTTG